MSKDQKVFIAWFFADRFHAGQERKYTGEPYINHPMEVAKIVSSVPHTDEMLMAAYLHDVVEDTEATIEMVQHWFGEKVAELVGSLTDVSKPSDGNRARRKKLDRDHIAKASPSAKTIKLADMISNSSSIMECDPKFAKTYMAEKKLLLEVLGDGDPALFDQAKMVVDNYYWKPSNAD